MSRDGLGGGLVAVVGGGVVGVGRVTVREQFRLKLASQKSLTRERS